MAETLKFGPEWMRNLSSDTHCRPQSPSAPTSRFKLAEHRYSKDDMLALFSSDVEAPPDLKLASKIFVEKTLEPLGFTALSEAEQKLLSQMSSSGTTSTSRPTPPTTTTRSTLSLLQLRGSESTRKTRGSGRLDPMYYKSSVDDDDHARTRHFNWDDSPSSKGKSLGYTGKSFDDPSSDVSRSMAADSWRGPKKKWTDDDTGNWRKQLPSQKPSNRSWREPWESSRSRGSDDVFKEKVFRRSFSSSHAQNNHYYDDDPEQLPEWSTDDFGDVGTFDATGAFMSVKELEKIEEQRHMKEVEDCSRDVNEGGRRNAEECSENNSTDPRAGSITASLEARESPKFNSCGFNGQLDEDASIGNEPKIVEAEGAREPELTFAEQQLQQQRANNDSINGSMPETNSSSLYAGMSIDVVNLVDSLMASNEEEDILGLPHNNDAINILQLPSQKQFGDSGLIDGGAHFSKHADLQSKFLLEEQQQQQFSQQFQSQQQPSSQILNQQLQQYQPHSQQQQHFIKGFVPPSHEDAYKWFYRDPQGEIQGPFTQLQMSEWFSVGYFNMNLLVKQGCDNNFLPIGTLVKLIGSNPFQIAYQTSAAMSHLKTQATNSVDQSLELQSQTQLSQQIQQLQFKQQQQQLDHLKIMQLLQLNPRNELLQIVQSIQQQQQLHQSNIARPLLEAINAQSATSGGDNGTLSLHQQLIQQHLQKQQQHHLSQFLQQQQQQQLGSFPHPRSFSSQSSIDSQPPFIGGGTVASNSTSYLLQTNQTSVPQQMVSSAWKTSNDISSYSSKAWDKGLMGLELSRPITAQALEQLQYLALEKQQQQRIDSSATALLSGGMNLNGGEQLNQMEGLSLGGGGGGGVGGSSNSGVRENQHFRAVFQQEAARLSLLNDERQRIQGSAEMLERQKLEELRRRQEKADVVRKLQEQQLETLKKLKQSQQGKHNALLGGLNSIQRQLQPLQRGSSPNFQSSAVAAAVSHPLESVLNFQHQNLLQKQQINKSWSLTNQSWVNGANGSNGGHALDVNVGAWGNPSYSKQQFFAPPSHAATTSFTNTTSDPNHLLDEPLHGARAGLYGSSLSTVAGNSIWLDGGNESHGLAGIVSQHHQASGNNSVANSYDKSLKESLTMWCESELKDQVPNGNIPSIIQQLLDSPALPETLDIAKAFFADPDKAANFAVGFLDRRNQLIRKSEHAAAVLLS